MKKMSSKPCLSLLLVGIAFLLMAGGTCDQTRLTGEILVPDAPIRTGQAVPLQLSVPESLSGIYRVQWEVDPRESGDMIYGSQLETLTDEELLSYFGTREINFDRVALFFPKEKGSCTIHVTGFYRQTNPQGITSLHLEVTE